MHKPPSKQVSALPSNAAGPEMIVGTGSAVYSSQRQATHNQRDEPMNEDQRQRLLADVEAFCEEVRPAEELCYLEHRFNDQAISLAKKHNLLGMGIDQEYGGRGADVKMYAQALARIGREGSGLRTLFSAHSSIGQYPISRFGTA